MKALANLLGKLGACSEPISNAEYQQKQCGWYNATPGKLTGYDCAECNNRGSFMVMDEGEQVIRECRCMAIRRSLWRIEASGLKHLLKQNTFSSFEDTEPWQKELKGLALRYLKDHDGKWFYIGGQVGCGKTHICTAIVGELLGQGLSARYMLWQDAAVHLKAVVMDGEDYGREISKLKRAPVLYIDDFFKTEQGKRPSTADIKIAFEIINYRYNDPGLITIISSEHSIDQLLDFDEATGSRIYQRTKEYCPMMKIDRRRNYRLRGGCACRSS